MLCHWPPFSHAEIAALKLVTYGGMPALRMSSNDDSARCHWPPFSHAEMTALRLIAFRVTPALRMLSSRIMFAALDHPTHVPMSPR